MPAPIVNFCIQQAERVLLTVGILKKNPLYEESRNSYSLTDHEMGQRCQTDNEVKDLAMRETDQISPPSQQRIGESIIAGFSEVLKKYGKAIILKTTL